MERIDKVYLNILRIRLFELVVLKKFLYLLFYSLYSLY
jgi:hypothetical protein